MGPHLKQPLHPAALPMASGVLAALLLVAIFVPDDPAGLGPSAPGGLIPTQPQPGLAAPPTASWPQLGAPCPRCGRQLDPLSTVCPRCGAVAGALGMPEPAAPLGFAAPTPQPAPPLAPGPPPADPATPGAAAGGLLTPAQQDAAEKELVEGHWLGLEVIPLTAALAKVFKISPAEQGVLVDEITLESAESGVLAGDVVRAIDDRPTPDLASFEEATFRVRKQLEARITVSRRGEVLTFVVTAHRMDELGTAQMEAAQPILPGAISPHRSQGKPCTSCHIIMKNGGQLPTDGGDLLPKPPPISPDATAPHADRGPCRACHTIIK